VTDKDGNSVKISDDILITATGQRPEGDALYTELENEGIRVERAGDTLGMGNLRTNALSGFFVGYNI